MARINLPEGKEDEIFRIWQLHPELSTAVINLTTAVYSSNQLSTREREVARMRIAQINDCPV
jgi:alkylhydroperoxidase family enzyme